MCVCVCVSKGNHLEVMANCPNICRLGSTPSDYMSELNLVEITTLIWTYACFTIKLFIDNIIN